jgi:hypothetical protein
MTDPIPASEIEAIRGRRARIERDPHFYNYYWAEQSHKDGATLLRALDAMAEENARMRHVAYTATTGTLTLISILINNLPPRSINDAIRTKIAELEAVAQTLKEPGQ